MKLKAGDIVKLVSDKYRDDQHNPRWGGECGHVKGVIDYMGDYEYGVAWENGENNGSYNDDDLELVTKKVPIDCRKLNKILCLKQATK